MRNGSSWRGASRLSSPASSTAASSEHWRCAAYWPSVCRVPWPMPRLGVVAARMKAGSSSSLATRRR
ncbi:Uncharacterised protein [Bordetella pertussis]|nr:Uncharacterised protein [Bordetella pertussis]